jgi:hypothetical protein
MKKNDENEDESSGELKKMQKRVILWEKYNSGKKTVWKTMKKLNLWEKNNGKAEFERTNAQKSEFVMKKCQSRESFVENWAYSV